MLNAGSATEPREINIGLPGGSVLITVDGFKHAHGLPGGPHHWVNGNAYEPLGTMGLMESVLWYGQYGLSVDSRTRLGGDKFSGTFTGSTSVNGLIRFDGALIGPIGKGWSFSLGAYVNYDPTSVHSPSRFFVDQKQIYQASLTKRWSAGESLSLLYRISLCNDSAGGTYSVAPFVYKGDGSISKLNGFRLGKDCYMPTDESATWMDLVSGKMHHGDMSRLNKRRFHDIAIMYKCLLDSGWKVEAGGHICYMAPSRELKVSLAGIDDVTADRGFSRPDGVVFSGLIQNRLAVLYDVHSFDMDIRLRAQRAWKRHTLQIGANLVEAIQYEAGSSFHFAHTAQVSPYRVFRNGLSTWGFNTNASYMNADKLQLMLTVADEWSPLERLRVKSGIRISPLFNNVLSAVRLEGETINTRIEGFNLSNPALAELHQFRRGGLDYVLSEHLSARLSRHFSVMAEGFFSMTEKTTTYFKNATLPSLKAIGNALVRGGLTFESKYVSLTALASYITSWNNAAAVSVTKQIGGISETQLYMAQYGIGTPGFTLDGNFHIEGFNLHLLATWQNPRYKKYRNEFTFSDGSMAHIDYTGNTVTGISRLMLEIDPSYRWKGLRVWTSIRYYSRQFVSRTNLAWFNGHFETFAGADWDIVSHHRVSLNLVNLFLQRGAKGSIDIADTIDDVSALEGFIMAGSYIRPFTAELSYTYKF